MRRKNWYIFFGVILVCAAFLVQYIRLRPAEIDTESVQPHTFVKKIEFNGSVAADGAVIYSPLNGEVQNIYVQENDTIQNKQPILRMDDPAYRAQLEQASLELETQEKLYNNQRQKMEDQQREIAMTTAQSMSMDLETFAQTVMPNPVDQAVQTQDMVDDSTLEEQLEGAKLKYQSAQDMMDLCDVNSIMDGDVVELYVRKNQQIAAGTPVCAVYDLAHSYLQAYVSQEDSQWISVSDEVNITGGMLGDEIVKGHVESFEHNLSDDPQLAGRCCIRIKPDDAAPFKQLGASYTVNIDIDTKTAGSIPLTALAQDEKGLYVLSPQNGVAKRIDVEIGMVDAGYVEVLQSGEDLSSVIMDPSSYKIGQRIKTDGQ